MTLIHTPERYITEFATVNGSREVVAIFYQGRTLKTITMRQMIQDRKKVFGDRWRHCESQNKKGMLMVTLKKWRGSLHKSELR